MNVEQRNVMKALAEEQIAIAAQTMAGYGNNAPAQGRAVIAVAVGILLLVDVLERHPATTPF